MMTDALYMLWVDGSYYEGVVGYGAVILFQPADKAHKRWHLSGGQSGTNPNSAEYLAAQMGLRQLPNGVRCVLHSDFLPVIEMFNTPGRDVLFNKQVTAVYAGDDNDFHREAHRLANRGRQQALLQGKFHELIRV
ncbi:MAG: hypothetical protein IT324_19375 [Anaerolineae bacterium]|nr:hypothetical protein [Anaerolineae bacterium]